MLEPLVPKREPGTIPIEAIHLRAVTADEHEKTLHNRLLRKQRLDQMRQSVDRLAHVDRLAADVGSNVNGDQHRAPPSWSRTKSAKRSACTPLKSDANAGDR
nr:hypothetical protein [Caballeronia sp. J97]